MRAEEKKKHKLRILKFWWVNNHIFSFLKILYLNLCIHFCVRQNVFYETYSLPEKKKLYETNKNIQTITF